MSPTRRTRPAVDWWSRRRDAAVERAARRTFDQLAADPTSFRRSPSRAAATALALAVLLVLLAVALLDLAVVVLVRAWWVWILVVLDLLLLVMLRPRRVGLATQGRLLSPAAQPDLHAWVGSLAERVGVRPPTTVAVSYDLNAMVQSYGWRKRPALVIGMPLWCALTPEGRVALLGHELGHLRHRDLRSSRVVTTALMVSRSVIGVLQPSPVLSGMYFGAITTRLANYLLLGVSVPFRALRLALEGLDARASQYDEYLADRRAATVAGTTAMRQVLALDLVGTWTRVAAEVRSGAEPFARFAAVEPASEDRIAAHVRWSRQQPPQPGSTHPPDHLRITLLEAAFVAPGAALPPIELTRGAEQEMTALQDSMRRSMSERVTRVYYN